MGRSNLQKLNNELRQEFQTLNRAIDNIRNKLEEHADGKKLKGDEIVGWLGEVYAKLLLDGTLVPDNLEYDVQAGNKKISAKARKGWGRQWQRSSAIHKIDGEGCPTHLMFLHFNDDYTLDKAWLYPWADLINQGRFKKHIVKGNVRSFIFYASEKNDLKYIFHPTPI